STARPQVNPCMAYRNSWLRGSCPRSRWTSALSGYTQLEQRRVLLRAEHVALAGAATGHLAANSELDRQRRGEFDERGEALPRNRIESRDGLWSEYPASLHELVRLAVAEDDVERDLIHAGVLAADGLRQLDQRPRRHRPTISSFTLVSSSGSLSGITWFTVHSYPGLPRRTSSIIRAPVPPGPRTSGSRAHE